jgi:hypothetical protein
VSHDELRSILGELDDAKAMQILALNPSLAELEEASIWAAGDGDVLVRSGHTLGRGAAAVVEILGVDEEDSRPVR